VSPASRAALAAVIEASAAFLDTAGVMPEIWNQPAPEKAFAQSMSPGSISAIAEPALS